MREPSRKVAGVLGALLLSASVLVTGVAAHSVEGDGAMIDLDISNHRVEPGVTFNGPMFVVDENGNQYPATIKDDHTVTYKRQVSTGCSWYNMVVPFGGSWYTSVDGCSLIGISPDAAHEYVFDVDNNSNGMVCVRARGYTLIGEAWWDVGCGKNGKKLITIGENITVAKIQGRSIGSTGTALFWK